MLIKKRKENRNEGNQSIFYSLFNDYMVKVSKAGDAFCDLVKDYTNIEDKVANIKVMETECDMQAHKILKVLHEAEETPFSRDDLYQMTKQVDDIVDSMEEAANRFLVFGVTEIRPEAIYMAELIVQAIKELKILFEHLEEVTTSEKVNEQIIEVNRLENEGDIIFRKALTKLFKEEKDPVEIVKWKHLFEELETCMDFCEAVANIFEGVIMKRA